MIVVDSAGIPVSGDVGRRCLCPGATDSREKAHRKERKCFRHVHMSHSVIVGSISRAFRATLSATDSACSEAEAAVTNTTILVFAFVEIRMAAARTTHCHHQHHCLRPPHHNFLHFSQPPRLGGDGTERWRERARPCRC